MSSHHSATPTPSQTHYEALGIDPTCSAAEIKQAHVKITVDNHPQRIHILTLTDEGKAAANARLVAANAAKEVLIDEEQRENYDKQLGYEKLSAWRSH
jgi:DnaJ-class molecular chaperone